MHALLNATPSWRRVEYVLNVETGEAQAYVEHDGKNRSTTTTFAKYLEDDLKLFSVCLTTFSNDGQKGATSAILGMRNAWKESHRVHVWRGKLDAVLARSLGMHMPAAGGGGGAGAAAAGSFTPDTEWVDKTEAALKESLEMQRNLIGSSTGIRQATDGISQEMARKTDTDAINAQMAGLRKTIDERDAQINKLTDHNRRQGYMLGELRGIQTELAQITADRDGLREQRNFANDALQRERAAHAGTMQQLSETRVALDRERDAARDARNAAAHDLRLVTDELRELQLARSQWELDRQRLMTLADDNRNAIMDAIADTLLGKRARTHQSGDGDSAA